MAFGLFWAFTFVSFARPEDIFPVIGNLHLTLLFGIAAALFYVRDLARGTVSFRWSAELILVLALTAWFLIGLPFGYYRHGSIDLLDGCVVSNASFLSSDDPNSDEYLPSVEDNLGRAD